MIDPDYKSRCKHLEVRVEELTFRNSQLEEQIGLALKPPTVFGLTWKQTAILGVLLANRWPRKECFMTALYNGRSDAPCVKIIDVYMSQIRKKLRPLGIEIRTLQGVGFEMPLDSKTRARQLMDAA